MWIVRKCSPNPHSGFVGMAVSGKLEVGDPKRIRADVLYHSIKRNAHLLRLSKPWSCRPYIVLLTGLLFSNWAISLQLPWATRDSSSCQLYGHISSSTKIEVCGLRLQTHAERLFDAHASSDQSLQNWVSQVETAKVGWSRPKWGWIRII